MSRRLPSLSSAIFACAALIVYAAAIAAPATRPVGAFATGLGEVRTLEDARQAAAPHAPRSDEHLTRQRDARPAGSVPASLPVAILPVAWTAVTVDSGRAFQIESEQQRVPTRIVSARTSRGPPDRRS